MPVFATLLEKISFPDICFFLEFWLRDFSGEKKLEIPWIFQNVLSEGDTIFGLEIFVAAFESTFFLRPQKCNESIIFNSAPGVIDSLIIAKLAGSRTQSKI